MKGIISFQDVSSKLKGYQTLGSILKAFEWAGSELPLLPRINEEGTLDKFIGRLLAVLDQHFPTSGYVYLMDEVYESPSVFNGFKLEDIVWFGGFNIDDFFSDHSDLIKFGLSLVRKGDAIWSDEPTKAWWRQLEKDYQLPPYEDLPDWNETEQILADLTPPWHHLEALCAWIEGGTDNPFVDIAPPYATQMIQLDWHNEDLDWLKNMHLEAVALWFGRIEELGDPDGFADPEDETLLMALKPVIDEIITLTYVFESEVDDDKKCDEECLPANIEYFIS